MATLLSLSLVWAPCSCFWLQGKSVCLSGRSGPCCTALTSWPCSGKKIMCIRELIDPFLVLWGPSMPPHPQSLHPSFAWVLDNQHTLPESWGQNQDCSSHCVSTCPWLSYVHRHCLGQADALQWGQPALTKRFSNFWGQCSSSRRQLIANEPQKPPFFSDMCMLFSAAVNAYEVLGTVWWLSWLPNSSRGLGNLLVRYLVFHFLAFISGFREFGRRLLLLDLWSAGASPVSWERISNEDGGPGATMWNRNCCSTGE